MFSIFQFLIISISSISFEFDDNIFKEKLKTAYEKPIIAVFYTPDCFYCDEVEDLYSELEKSKNSFSFTLINCRNTKICDKYAIRGLPVVYFIASAQKRDWISHNFTNINDVESFIKMNTKITIKKATASVIENITDRSMYYINALNEKDPLLNEIRRHQYKKYRNNKFFYQINAQETGHSSIRAYLTDDCVVEEKFDDPKIEVPFFIEKTQYAAQYLYDDFAIKIAKSNSKLILFTDELSSIQREFLIDIQNKFCGTIFVGYSNNKESPLFLSKHMLSKEKDFPLVVFSKDNCTSFYKGRLKYIAESMFIEDSLKQISCGKTYGLINNKNKNSFQDHQQNHQKMKKNHNYFSQFLIYCISFIVTSIAAVYISNHFIFPQRKLF